jgi:multidrug efflux pump
MNLAHICIQRPVLTLVLNIALVLFGIIGLRYLGVREFPSVERPVISVTTNYVGASAEVIESQITEPLEEYVSGIDGVRQVTSVSREERSTITVEFELGIDLNDAANNVIEKVSRAQRQLPLDADPPIIAKEDGNSQPIIALNIRSKTRNALELTEIADKIVKQRMQTIAGVSQVPIWGAQTYSMRLWLNADRMATMGVTPADIQTALQRENVELPAGRVEGNTTELSVRTLGRLRTPQDFNNLALRQEGNRTVRLSDVGYAILGPENQRTVLKRENVPMVAVAIIPQPGANYLDIAQEFHKRMAELKKDLPADVELVLGFDSTTFITKAIEEVVESIVVAFILVIFIIFLFLRDWRTTLIPVLAIPISLIGAFFIMYVMDYSINILTLLAMVLAIGIVVDDAIVMMENIYAKIEGGMDPYQAALKGSREVYFAVIVTTVALVVVFLPVIFLEGLVGRLFVEFGVVLGFTVIVSGFVALTLTPMACRFILQRRNSHGWLYRVTEPAFVALTRGYARWLHAFMQARWQGIAGLLAAGLLVWLIGSELPSELAPLEDRAELFLPVTGPEGATFEYMERFMNDLTTATQQAVASHERTAIISVTSPGFSASGSVNSGFLRLILSEPQDRSRSQKTIAQHMTAVTSQLTGARTAIIETQTIGGGRRGGLPVQYVVLAPTNEALRQVLPRFSEALRKDPTFVFTDVNLKLNKPELVIAPDRERARDLQVSVLDISRALQLALSSSRYGYYIQDGKQYQVIGQLERPDRDKPTDISRIYVRAANGQQVKLDQVVRQEESVTTPALYRTERYPSATFSAALAPGKTVGDGIAAMDRIAAEVLPDNFRTTLTDASRDYQESSNSLLFGFALAIVLVFLVLAAQFESFRDPVIILLNVLTALAGALLSLWWFDQTLNIFSQIGIIMLIGLVTKNGILIVEFANQRKAEGLDRMAAVLEAAEARFRPILMTSLSTILGFLPIALALGNSAESRMSMGIAVVGGLTISSFLSLFFVPALYSYISTRTRVAPPAEQPEETPASSTSAHTHA